MKFHFVQIFLICMAIVTAIVTAIARPILKVPTVSMTNRDWAKVWSWFPFAVGFLIGHIFAPVESHWRYASVVWLVPLLSILIGIDFWCLKKNIVKTSWKHWRWPLWWLLLGIPAGLLLWPQIG